MSPFESPRWRESIPEIAQGALIVVSVPGTRLPRDAEDAVVLHSSRAHEAGLETG
jgi:hypothetical protein